MKGDIWGGRRSQARKVKQEEAKARSPAGGKATQCGEEEARMEMNIDYKKPSIVVKSTSGTKENKDRTAGRESLKRGNTKLLRLDGFFAKGRPAEIKIMHRQGRVIP